MNEHEVTAIVLGIIKDYIATLENPPAEDILEDTILMGDGGILDSLGLVNIIIDVESRFRDMGHAVTLADEKAMSRRHSPFRSAKSLAHYIKESIDGAIQ